MAEAMTPEQQGSSSGNPYAKMAMLDRAYSKERKEFGKRQYLGEAADRVLLRLREAYVDDLIGVEKFEALVGDILAGRPVALPFAVKSVYRSKDKVTWAQHRANVDVIRRAAKRT